MRNVIFGHISGIYTLMMGLFFGLTALGQTPIVPDQAFDVNSEVEKTAEVVALTAPEKMENVTIAKNFVSSAKTVAKPVATKAVVAKAQKYDGSITVLGKTNAIEKKATSTDVTADHVSSYNNGKFLYGHNSAAVFGNLKNLKVGNTFSVTLDGVTKTYKVVAMETLTKAVTSEKMGSIVKAKYNGVRHGVALMTCAGKAVGNGDATHRLIIYADEV